MAIATLQQIKNLLGITTLRTQVNDELAVLTGTTATALLNKNYYDNNQVSSIVVTDATGTVLYQLGIDYTVSLNGSYYTTITRTAGSTITSGATVKVSYVYIGENEEDDFINELLPIVENDIIELTNNKFGSKVIDSSDTVSFTASSKKIEDVNAELDQMAGDFIYIQGSRRNDGIFTVVTESDTYLTVSETIVDEAEGADVSIYWCHFPAGLRIFVADMIQVRMQQREVGVLSDSVSGAYSRTYSDGGGEYPNELKKMLMKKYGVVRAY